MSSDTAVEKVLIVDYGPVRDAALILAESTTLADHVNIADDNGHTTRIEMWGDVPFEMWGSGTQGLWLLLSAITYRRHEVSLYEVASRLDRPNSAAAARALAALFGVTRL